MNATKQKLVMIGNGMAGMRTIDELLKRAPDKYDITIIGAEKVSSYNRIQLSPVLAGEKTFDAIVTHDDEWHRHNNIELFKGQLCVAIDRDKRIITLADGSKLPYDKLIIATGSEPFIAPIEGVELNNVIAFRDVKHVEKMLQYRHDSRVVVIGGGLLGLEAAYGLAKLGADVTVVHRADILMNRQLDSYGGELLQATLADKSLKFACGANTAKLIGNANGDVAEVHLADGRVLPADLVVMAIGIVPNRALGESAGLDCEKGILVDQFMQTSDPNIYAVGECTEFESNTFGLVAPLFDQAVSLAATLSDNENVPFELVPTATRLKVTGVELFSAGQYVEDESCETIWYRDPQSSHYKKLVIRDDIIVGIVLYGDTRDGNWYYDLMLKKQNIADIRPTLIFGQMYHDVAEVA